MAVRYEIREAFTYEANTLDGVVSGDFPQGVTGDLTDEQRVYLEQHAVPAGLAVVVDDAAPQETPAPPSEPQEPVTAVEPQEPTQ